MPDPDVQEAEARELPPFQIPGMRDGFSVAPTGSPPQVQALPPFNIPGLGQTGTNAALLRALMAGNQAPQARAPQAGLMAQHGDITEGLPPLYQPKRVALPTAPTAPKSSEWQEQKPFLMALAMLASSFTRQPAVAAMKAMAGMLQGERQGNQEAYQNSRAEYQDALSKALNEQKQELEEYQTSYNNRSLAWSERMAQMRATAVKRGHGAMIQTLDAGADPGALLDSMDRAGVFLSEPKKKAAYIAQAMKNDPNLTNAQAEVMWGKYKQGIKEGVAGEKPLTVAQQKAKAIEEELAKHLGDPNYSRAQAIRDVEARNSRSDITGNKRAELEEKQIQTDEALDRIDGVISTLNKYRMAAGAAGKAFRGIEIVGNITGADVQTDREQMRRDLEEIMMMYPRIVGQGGRPLAIDAKRVEAIIGGLALGDTTANSIRSLEEARNTLMRFKSGRGTILQKPGGAPAPGAPQPSQEIDWNAFPKAE